MRRSATQQPPLGVRLVYSVRKEPDYRTLTPTQLAALGEAANRVVNSRFARLLTGIPHSGVTIGWRAVELADRTIRVRVYRPKDSAARNLPLVLHIHGGGYVGSAVQCDWINSHMAARASALVVSVEHRDDRERRRQSGQVAGVQRGNRPRIGSFRYGEFAEELHRLVGERRRVGVLPRRLVVERTRRHVDARVHEHLGPQ
jgi:hypothetical protein